MSFESDERVLGYILSAEEAMHVSGGSPCNGEPVCDLPPITCTPSTDNDDDDQEQN